MNIFYVANVRVPTEKAHGLQIMKMCEAFSRLAGASVTLLVPRRPNPIVQDPFEYYGVSPAFRIEQISVPSVVHPLWVLPGGFFIENLVFARRVLKRLREAGEREAVIYGRDALTLFFLAGSANRRSVNRRIFFEIHDVPRRFFWFWRAFARRAAGFVSTNRYKAEFFSKNFGAPQEKILVAPNGFDPQEFENVPPQAECRQKLSLPLDKKITLYTGHLYDWKGAAVLRQAADLDAKRKSQNTKDSNEKILFVFVGGTDKDIARFREDAKGLDNVLVAGRRPHQEIPLWLSAADVLALPNSAKSEESVWATSPIKLFEYMAAGKTIIVSDLPSVREIVSEREVYFARPDEPDSLLQTVKTALADPAAAQKAGAAKEKSRGFSWSARARKISEWILRASVIK